MFSRKPCVLLGGGKKRKEKEERKTVKTIEESSKKEKERERERDRGEDSGCIDVSSSRVAFDVHGMMRVPLHESNRGKRKKKKDGSRAECVVEDGWIEENRPVSPMIKAIKPRIGGRAIGSWSR